MKYAAFLIAEVWIFCDGKEVGLAEKGAAPVEIVKGARVCVERL